MIYRVKITAQTNYSHKTKNNCCKFRATSRDAEITSVSLHFTGIQFFRRFFDMKKAEKVSFKTDTAKIKAFNMGQGNKKINHFRFCAKSTNCPYNVLRQQIYIYLYI